MSIIWYTFSNDGEPLHPATPKDKPAWAAGEVTIKGAVLPPVGNEQRWIAHAFGNTIRAQRWDGVPVPFHASDPAVGWFMAEVQAADEAHAIQAMAQLRSAYGDEVLQKSRLSRDNEQVWSSP